MSATKRYLEEYSEGYDALWSALEDAICKANALNDLVYDGQEIRCRVPRADASLLADKLKELKSEINCFENAKEPLKLSPLLPGELRFA